MRRADGSRRDRPAPSNLQLRIVSAAVLAAVAVGATWAGGAWFRLFSGAVGATVFIEWCLITQAVSGKRHQAVSAVVFAAVLCAALSGWAEPVWVLAAGTVLCLAAGLVMGPWRWTVAGFVYAGFSAIALAAIRGGDTRGLAVVLVLFAVVWATDVMAYFVGRALKGPKLAPAISPGKTWSGAAGGTLFGVAAGAAAAWLLETGDPGRVAMLSLLLSVVSQAGDLFESWVKRRHGVKDSSRIIPGHGGVMDRVDGLVAAAMALYLVAAVWGGGDAGGWIGGM